jgi:hypothetical protein
MSCVHRREVRTEIRRAQLSGRRAATLLFLPVGYRGVAFSRPTRPSSSCASLASSDATMEWRSSRRSAARSAGECGAAKALITSAGSSEVGAPPAGDARGAGSKTTARRSTRVRASAAATRVKSFDFGLWESQVSVSTVTLTDSRVPRFRIFVLTSAHALRLF